MASPRMNLGRQGHHRFGGRCGVTLHDLPNEMCKPCVLLPSILLIFKVYYILMNVSELKNRRG